MKKIVSVFVLVVFMFAMSGCSYTVSDIFEKFAGFIKGNQVEMGRLELIAGENNKNEDSDDDTSHFVIDGVDENGNLIVEKGEGASSDNILYYPIIEHEFQFTMEGDNTECLDVTGAEDPEAFFNENRNANGDINVLPILCDYDATSTEAIEKCIMYFITDNVATPMLISFIKENGVICKLAFYNLNNAEYTESEVKVVEKNIYEEINTVPEN